MKIISRLFITAALTAAVASCNFLEPLPNGAYTDENYKDYVKIIEGYVFKAYSLLPENYVSNEYIGSDHCTDDLVNTGATNTFRQFSIGNAQPGEYPYQEYWKRDYLGISYVNRFLKDDIGLNARYLVEPKENAVLQQYLQGDAYGMRAWYLFDLVKKFSGKTKDGKLLGVPIVTDVIDLSEFQTKDVRRASLDDCITQVLNDCDSAIKYLPAANRDFVVASTATLISGAARYRMLDGVSIKALKALVYLFWASPAFNPEADLSRYDNAAKYAAEVMNYKLTVEGAQSKGFNPMASFYFTNPNDPEIIWLSNWGNKGYEEKFYPLGFKGSAKVAPTQELVDAFPMANGYPITDIRSGYDEDHPFVGRDPRFYANINADGSQVRRGGTGEVMYTFNTREGGADAPGMVGASTTGYYVKRYIYSQWNGFDKSIQTSSSSIFFLRWTHMCLAFAEAANEVAGPTTEKYGFTAKQAIAYLRSRTTQDGTAGLGAVSDPYLDECASAGKDAFGRLVKNEWRLETCFEGWRFINLRRWGATAADLNIAVHGISIAADGTISHPVIEVRNFPSEWMPIPYYDTRRCRNLVQNAGWENWR